MNTQKSDKSLYHKAAEICLYAPMINIAIFYFTKNTVTSISKAIFFITTAFYLIGFISGIIALFGIKKYGTKGILKKALLGLAITGIIFAIAIPNFFRYRAKSKQTQIQLNELKKNAMDEVAKDGTPGEKTETYVKETRKTLNNYVESASGDDRLAMEVILKFNNMIQDKAKNFQEKAGAINEGFWDFTQLKADSDYQNRYKITDSAYEAANDIMQLYRDAEKNLDSMFKDVAIKEEKKQTVIKGFLSSFNRNSDKGIRLYDINAKQFLHIKNIFKFLHEHKDSWNIQTGNIAFDQEDLSQEFNDKLSTIDQMDAEKIQIIKSLQKDN